MADADRIGALFAHVDAEFGRLDGVVNNAGIAGAAGRLEDLDAATPDRVLAVNIRGTILAAQAGSVRACGVISSTCPV